MLHCAAVILLCFLSSQHCLNSSCKRQFFNIKQKMQTEIKAVGNETMNYMNKRHKTSVSHTAETAVLLR